MGKRLVNKSKFAQIAGVSPASVTKASKGAIKDALVGDRIDLDHQSAVEYITNHQKDGPPPLVKGIDPLYEKAIKYCEDNNRWSVEGLRHEFNIGYKRAKAIFDTMKANKVIKKKPIKKKNDKKPHKRGTAAAKETRKRASLAALNKKIKEDEKEVGNLDQLIEIPPEIQAFADMTLRDLITQFGTVQAFEDWLNAVKRIEDINEKRLKIAKMEGDLVSRVAVQKGIIDPIESAHIQLLTDGVKTITQRAIILNESGSDHHEIEEYIRKQISKNIKSVKGKVRKSIRNV